MQRLRIAFIAGILEQGGAERQLYNIIALLKNEKVDVDLYCFEKSGFWKDPIEKLNVKITWISGNNRLQRFLSLAGLLRYKRYDFVHSQHFYTNLYATFGARFCGAKSIGSVRNDVVSEVKAMGFMGYPSLLWPSRLAANSKMGIQNAIKFSRKLETIFFLPNFVDLNAFHPGIAKKNNEFRVIAVGTIWGPKRIDRVIDVAALLLKKPNQTKKIVFHVFGDGDMMDTMIDYARSKGVLNSNVIFRGRTSNIASEYRLADALLLTSDHEGTPNVVLEAMASELPVISTVVGDAINIISNGSTGYLVNFTNKMVDEIAGHLEFLANNPDHSEKMGRLARLFINKNNSVMNLKEALFKLYSSGSQN